MTEKQRADLAVVEQGLAESRAKAQAMIMAGEIFKVINNSDGGLLRIEKPGEMIPQGLTLISKGDTCPYVSRGGLKLEEGIRASGFDLTNQRILDIGASTGGFTHCALLHGAKEVVALDVGHSQLHDSLRHDKRVQVIENTNIRYLEPGAIAPVDGIVIDVSFISLLKALPPAWPHLKENGWFICLIKPQFEAERNEIGKGGVVRDDDIRENILQRTIASLNTMGFPIAGHTKSPIQGQKKGNIEYLAWGHKGAICQTN